MGEEEKESQRERAREGHREKERKDDILVAGSSNPAPREKTHPWAAKEKPNTIQISGFHVEPERVESLFHVNVAASTV